MRRSQFICTALLTLSVFLNAQVWTWDQPVYSHNSSFKFFEDSAGNVYNLQPGNSFMQSSPTLQKLDPDGTLLWQTTFPSTLVIKSVAPSVDGAVYLAGNFESMVSLYNVTGFSQGGTDIWVAKFSDAGNFIWLKTIASYYDDEVTEICMSGNELVVTGVAGSTLNVTGTPVAKQTSKDFFLTKLTNQGNHKATFFSKPVDTVSTSPHATGLECASDPAGNIYVMAEFTGKTQHLVDTFHIGYVNSDAIFTTKVIIKLNAQLKPVYVYKLADCFWWCNTFHDLNVNANGECYYVDTYSYGQSGNDDLYSSIRRLSTAGVFSQSFQPRPDKRNFIYDIDLDKCGNVAYTGFCRDYSNAVVNYRGVMVGELDPALNHQWMRVDSICNKPRTGMAVATHTPNQLFIGGFFVDTMQLNSLFVDTSSYYNYSGFYAGMRNSAVMPCAITTALNEHTEPAALSLFPNPCNSILYLNNLAIGTEVRVFSCSGTLVHQGIIQNESGSLDTSRFPSGIYLLQVKDGLSSTAAKVLIQH